MTKAITLLDAAAATGSAVQWGGGDGTLQIFGTFDGATVSIQVSLDGGTTYTTVPTAEYTAETVVNASLAPCKIRAAIGSPGAGTAVSCVLVPEMKMEQM